MDVHFVLSVQNFFSPQTVHHFQHFLTPNPFHGFFSTSPPPKSGTHLWSHRDFCQRGRHGELKRSSSLEKTKFFCCSNFCFPKWSFQTQRRKDPGHKKMATKGEWQTSVWSGTSFGDFFLMSWPDQKGDVMYRFSWDSVQSCTSRLRRIFLWKNLGYTSFLGVYIQSNSMTTFQNTKKKCTENRVRHSELAPQKGARRGKLLRNWWWLWQELAPNVGSSKGVFLVAFRTFEVWKIKYGIFLPENKDM